MPDVATSPQGLYYRDPSNPNIVRTLFTPEGPPDLTGEQAPTQTQGVLGRIATGFGRGIVRGAEQTGGMIAGGLSLLNIPGTKAIETSLDDAAAQWHTDVGSLGQVTGPSDLFVWASENIAENAPTIAAVLAGSFVGGWAAAAPAALRGLQTAASAMRIGSWTGAAATDLALNAGDTMNSLRQAGIEPTWYNTAPAAVLKASLDLLPEIMLAKRLGLGSKFISEATTKAALDSGIVRFADSATGLVLTEGATEGLQQYIDLATQNIIQEGQLRLPNKAEEWAQIGEAAASGAVSMAPGVVVSKFTHSPSHEFRGDVTPEKVVVTPEEPTEPTTPIVSPTPEPTGTPPGMPPIGAPSPEPTPKPTPTPTPNEEPPLTSGMVRVYHSGSLGEGDSGRWVSTSRQYASDYRPGLPLHYLDLAANDPRLEPHAPDQGVEQGFTFNFELTPEEAKGLTPISRGVGPKPIPTDTPPDRVVALDTQIDHEAADVSAGKSTNTSDYIAERLTAPDKPTLVQVLQELKPEPQVAVKALAARTAANLKHIPRFVYVSEAQSVSGARQAFTSLSDAQSFANATNTRLFLNEVKGDPIFAPRPSLVYFKPESLRAIPSVDPSGTIPSLTHWDSVQEANRVLGEAIQGKPEKFQEFLSKGLPPWAEKKYYRDLLDPLSSVRTNWNEQQRLDQIAEKQDSFTIGNVTHVGFESATTRRDMVLLQAWIKRYAPHVRLTFTDSSSYIPDVKAHAQIDRIGPSSYAIYKNISSTPAVEFQTLAHEFGHLIMWEHYESAPSVVQQALQWAYYEWLDRQANATVREFWNQYGSVFDTRRDITPFKFNAAMGGGSKAYRAYLLSFSEWFAQQVSVEQERSGAEGAGLVRRFFAGLVEKLRTFYTQTLHGRGLNVEPGAQVFINYVAQTAKMQRLYKEVAPFDVEQRGYAGSEVLTHDTPSAPTSELASYQALRSYKEATHEEPPAHVQTSLARFGKFQEWGYTLLQLAKRYPHIKGVQDYSNLIQQQWADKSKIEARANESIRKWHKLGRDQSNRFSKFVFDVTLDSNDKGRRLTPDELAEWAKKHGLKDEANKLYAELDGHFRNILDELKANLMAEATTVAAGDSLLLELKTKQINEDFAKLSARNYFPLARFGTFGVRVKALKRLTWEGKIFTPGQVMSFETFEKRKEGETRASELLKSFGATPDAVQISTPVLDDLSFSFIGIPPSVIESIAKKLDLSPEQFAIAKEVVAGMSPSQSFKRNLIRRKGTAGFSQDAMRAFASYMQHAAGHISRGRYYGQLMAAIDETGRAQLGYDRPRLTSYLKEHYKYVNNPGNEWSSVRGFMFGWYLGFSIKSAFVNLTQVPLVAYPWLAARYGDVQTTLALARANRDAMLWVTKGKGVTPAEAAMLAQGSNEGWLDESLATELAGEAEGGGLRRFTAGTAAQRLLWNVQHLGALGFKKVELYNRAVTALAAYRLGGTTGVAKDAVQTTMFEYARWNRAKFMRGKKSVLFVFKTYLQHMLYLFGNEKGRGRALLMLFAAAGLQGLPFGEDLLDAYDALKSLLGRWTGWVDPRSDARTELRQFVQELGADPNFVMHGFGQEGFGMGFDISRSLSSGRIIPAVEPIARALSLGSVDPNALISDVGEEVGGAATTVGFNLIKALAGNDPNSIKNYERLMPSAARDVSRALRYANAHVETNSLGDVLAEFDPGDASHQAEIVKQALGFRPSRITAKQERNFAQYEAEVYYNTRRSLLLTQYFNARKAQDREAVADVRDSIGEFNHSTPFPTVRITPAELSRSFAKRTLDQKKRERDQATTRRYGRLQQEVGAAYPQPGAG